MSTKKHTVKKYLRPHEKLLTDCFVFANIENMKKTLTKISEETGLSISYLSELLSGVKDNPTYKTIVKIATCLGCDPDLEKIILKYRGLKK